MDSQRYRPDAAADDFAEEEHAEAANEALRQRQRAQQHTVASEKRSSLADSRASARQHIEAQLKASPAHSRRSQSSIVSGAVSSLPLSTLATCNDADLHALLSPDRRAASAGAMASPPHPPTSTMMPRVSSANSSPPPLGALLSQAPLTFLSDKHSASPRRSPHHIQPMTTAQSSSVSSAALRESPPPPLHALMRSSPPAMSALPPGLGTSSQPRPLPRSMALLAPLTSLHGGEKSSAAPAAKIVSLRQINALLHSKSDPLAAACAPDCLALLRRFVQQNQDPSSSPYLQDSSASDGGVASLMRSATSPSQPLFSLLLHPHLATRGAQQAQQLLLATVKILTRKPENRTDEQLVNAALIRALLSQLCISTSSSSSSLEVSSNLTAIRKEVVNILFNLCFESRNASLLLECDGLRHLMLLLEGSSLRASGGSVAAEPQLATLDPLDVSVTAGVVGILHAVCYQSLGTSCFVNYRHNEQADGENEEKEAVANEQHLTAFDLLFACLGVHLGALTASTEDGGGVSDPSLQSSLLQLLSRAAGLLLNLSAHPRAVKHICEHPQGGMHTLVQLLQLQRDDISGATIGVLANVSKHPSSRAWIAANDGANLSILTLLANCLFLSDLKSQSWAVCALLGFCDPAREDRGGGAQTFSPMLHKYRALLHAFLANSMVLGMMEDCATQQQEENDAAVE